MILLRPGGLHLLWLAIPIVVFFLVRRRTRPTEVSSLLLWRKVLAAESRRPWWGRLREWISLLLNLLILAGLAIAAAGPRRIVAGPAPETWAVVLDAGVTMHAEIEPGRTRLDRAKKTVMEVLGRLAPRDRVVVVRAGAAPVLLAPPGPAGHALRTAVEETAASSGPSDLAAAVAFARAASGGAPDRLLVVGDRDPGVPGTGFLAAAAEATPNAGFTGVDARRDAVSLATTVTCVVAAAGPGEVHREVVLCGPGGHVATTPVTIAAGGAEVVSFTFEPRTRGRAVVTLRPADGYPRDDRIAVPVAPPRRLRLLVRGVLDSFLESALRAQGDRIDRAHSGVIATVPTEVPRGAVLLLVGRERPPEVVRGNVWVLDAPGGSVRDRPAVTGWTTDHPVMRGLDLGNLGLRRARPRTPIAGETALVTAEGGAVVTAREGEGLRELRFGFTLTDSNFPVLAAFPLLVRNALAWFAGLEDRLFPAAIREDEPLEPRARLPRAVHRVHLSGPAAGGVLEVPVRDGRIAHRLPPGAAEKGALVVRVGDRAETVAVNPISREIRAFPADPGRLGIDDLPRRRARPDPPRSLQPYLLAAIGALLLLEWWHHQRGRRGQFG